MTTRGKARIVRYTKNGKTQTRIMVPILDEEGNVVSWDHPRDGEV